MNIYRSHPDMVHRSIAGSEILIPTGDLAMKSNAVIELTETGAFLWDHLKEEPGNADELAKILTHEYEVSYDRALADVGIYLEEMMREGGVVCEQK